MAEPWLICGDAIEEMRKLKSGSIDMVMTDPPYGTTNNAWDSVIPLEPLWAELRRVAKPEAAIVLMAAEPFTSALITSNLREFKYRWTWNKVNRNGNVLNARKQPIRIVEDAVVFYREQPVYTPSVVFGKAYKTKSGATSTNYREIQAIQMESDGRQYARDLIEIPADERGTVGRLHPTQKPVALMEYFILTYTRRGATVLDFAMGSGTTGVACARTGRNFIGIEINPDYVKMAFDRIERGI